MLEATTVETLPTTTEQFNGEMSILVESTTVGPPPTELYGEIPILLESTTVEPPPSTTEQLDGPTTTVAKETTTVEVMSALTDLKFPSLPLHLTN